MNKQLRLDFVPGTVKPGTAAEIEVETTPNSYVAVLAVDERAVIGPSRNDIDESEVIDERNSFSFSDVLGTKDVYSPYSLFSESNAVLITDANSGAPDCGMGPSARSSRIKRQAQDDNDEISSDQSVYETWMFESFQADSSGRKTLIKAVPELFTSYIVTGFSIHPTLGMSVAKPTRVGVFADFFIEFNTPHKGTVGDVLKIELEVYNFMRNTENVQVILEKNDKFEVVQTKPSDCYFASNATNVKRIQSKVNQATPAFFHIRLVKDGPLKLVVRAETARLSTQKSSVITIAKPGLEKSDNRAKFIDLRSRRFDSFYFDMYVDDTKVKSSVSTEVSVVGDLMGPALENIESLLVDSPIDSAEQQMIKFMPTAIALNYLKATNKMTSQMKIDGPKTLESGYNFISSRKLSGRDGGAYQLGRSQSGVGNIAMTAYVCKYLAVAKDWIEVNDRLITDALNFLKKKQARDGKFTGEELSEEAIPSELSEDTVLTAFVVIAFLENVQYIDRYQVHIDKGIKFINSKFEDIKSNQYALAISSYAMALAKSSEAEKFLNELMAVTADGSEIKFPDRRLTDSKKVEIASYAILAHVKLERTADARHILNWLISKRNREGGFFTPSDTIVGLQAVAEMAKHLFSSEFNMNLYFLYDEPNKILSTYIDNNNKIESKKFAIPTSDGVSLQANGTGVAYVQVWQKFYWKPANYLDKFDVKVTRVDTGRKLDLKICLNTNDRTSAKSVIAEVSLPSGYEFDDDIKVCRE